MWLKRFLVISFLISVGIALEEICVNQNCVPICKVTTHGTECYCNDGYVLEKENSTCTDLDECLTDGICSQQCQNSFGSYNCSCLNGYELDGTNCYALGPDPLLLYASFNRITALNIRTKNSFHIHNAIGRAITVSSDPLKSKVYWLDISSKRNKLFSFHASVYTSKIDGTDFGVVLNRGLLMPESVDVDYVGRNLYLTDSYLKSILVCKVDGKICSVLHSENLQQPRAIKVEPFAGLIYWSDWGDSPGIFRSGMDGSDRTVLISSNIMWPNDIVVDYTTRRLFWVDAGLRTIEYITLDGASRKVIADLEKIGVNHAFSLSVFENRLYWTDRYTLKSVDKFSGNDVETIAYDGSNYLLGTDFQHPVLAREADNPCLQNNCSHLCTVAPGNKFRCFCPTGHILFDDEYTCMEDETFPILLINDESRIIQIRPGAVGDSALVEWPDMQLNNPLVTKDITAPEDIAFDWMSENLYWVDSSKGTVNIISPKTFLSTVIIDNLIRPSVIVLGPEVGLMFIMCLEEEPSVAMYSMDGSNRVALTSIKNPAVALAVHPSSSFLYWVDQDDGQIAYLDYLDPYKEPVIVKDEVEDVTSIAVTERFLYLTEARNSAFYILSHQRSSRVAFKFHLPEMEKERVSRKFLHYVNPAILESAGQSLCTLNNGGCSHLCVTAAFHPRCLCPEGMYLLEDRISCAYSNLLEDYLTANIVTIDRNIPTTKPTDYTCQEEWIDCKNGRCVSIMWKCDGDDDCGNNVDEENCDYTCQEEWIHCKNGRCESIMWKCDGDDDCGNYVDEENCDFTCKVGWIDCKNGKCVSSLWKCDGDNDCGNNMDEENCDWNTSSESTISDNLSSVTTIPPTETSDNNPCKHSPCSYKCLSESQGKYRCVCPPELTLSKDGRMCLISMLFVYDDSRVYSFIPESGRNSDLVELPDFEIDTISRLAYDWKSQTYFVIDKKNVVLYSINMNTLSKRELVSNSLDTPEDLAFDWLSDNLYWVDSGKGTVEVISPASYRNVELITDLVKPTAIALVPKLGIMFVSTTGEKASIHKFDMDGRNRLIIAATAETTVPIAVHYSANLLYWADSQTGEISYIDYMMPNSLGKATMESRFENVVSIALSDNYLYWTDTGSHLLHSMFLNDTVSFPIILPSLEDKSFHRRILYTEAAVAAQLTDEFPCSVNNGGCSYLCLTTKAGRSCACPTGLELSKDNITCTNAALKSSLIKIPWLTSGSKKSSLGSAL